MEEDIKEIQETITPQPAISKATEDEWFNVLKMVAPGTNLRVGLDGALKAGKGALIAVENEQLMQLIDGGFRVNCRFTPQRLVELSKMDGAIVLSKDLKRINYANVLLTPDSKLRTHETGTRHKAAERTAKQIGTLVVAISERRHETSVFYKNMRYVLKDTGEILRKANEHIQLIEKQRELFDKNLERLTYSELRNYDSLHQALLVIQKGRLIQKISEDIKRHLLELGNEGTLLKTRLKEITSGIDREVNLIIKDYTKLDLTKSKILLESLAYDEILDTENILRILAYENTVQNTPIKGWRILSKTSLEEADIAQIIKQMGSLGKALHSNAKSYTDFLGEDKGLLVKQEIEKIKLLTVYGN